MMFKNVLCKINNHANNNRKCIETMMFFIVLFLCLVYSYAINHNVNFVPINGTYQDFNPVRRLLNGQIPVKDFFDYLGFGHLYFGGLLTYLLGGNFYSSLVAFDFGRMLIGSFLFYTIAISITNNRILSLSTLIVFLMAIFAFSSSLSSVLVFRYLLKGGASARYIRAGILPICCVVVGTVHTKISDYLHKSIILGVMAGISFLWSNDVGISCFVCIIVHFIVMLFINKHSFIKSIFLCISEMVSSIITIFIVGSILTHGNFLLWISKTFGIGGFQSWYYNSDKSLYLYDVDLTITSIMIFVISIFYLAKLYINHRANKEHAKYTILLFLTMTCFCSLNEYKLLSGDHSTEVSQYVLMVIVLMELVKYLFDRLSNKYSTKCIFPLLALVLFGSVSWIMFYGFNDVKYLSAVKQKEDYVPELGGELSKYYEDIMRATQFLNGKTIFSMYASAQEVIENQFQPSGTDYIIHVLGDNNRKEYLKIFDAGKFDYVTTIKEENSVWEPWVVRANWFVYRELFEKYHPVFANEYEYYWQKNNNTMDTYNGKIDINVTKNNGNSYIISIFTDKEINGYADVYVSYTSSLTKELSSLLVFNKMVRVENLVENYGYDYTNTNFLRFSGGEYVPVRIIDGYGELQISSIPEKNTTLKIDNICCDRVLMVEYNYVEITDYYIKDSNTVLVVDSTPKNMNKLKSKNKLMIGDEYHIEKIVYEDDCISIYTEKKAFKIIDELKTNIIEVR